MSETKSGTATVTAKATSSAASPPASGRLLSLDALRGFDMFWIVGAGALVGALAKMGDNSAIKLLGTQLTHVQWAGFHFYDLIFPLFVFIAGVSMVFSLPKSVAQHGKAGAILRLGKRCLLLFVVGIFYYGGFSNSWPNIRLIGVLQYIGFASFCAGTTFIFLRQRPAAIAGVFVAFLIGYWALLAFVPFPDLHLDKESLAKTIEQVHTKDPAAIAKTVTKQVHGVYEEGYNLTHYIDFRFLPGKKLGGAYDNQGLLNALGPVATCLLGILAGIWLRREKNTDWAKVGGLLAAGIVCACLGWAWNIQFPVVKKLWNGSFVLVAGGYSMMLLGVFYAIVEIGQMQRWCQPFVWIGMNPITIYLAHNILSFGDLSKRFVGGDIQHFLDAHLMKGSGSLLVAIVELLLTFALVRFLYMRKIFLRL